MARLAINVLGGFEALLVAGVPCTLPTRKAQVLSPTDSSGCVLLVQGGG
jgi:hypothetical protein